MIAYSPAIGPVPLSVVLSEQHELRIEITANPIEDGSEVNDHAYILPNRVTLEVASRNAVATLAALKAFQRSRVPFTLVTGLAVYTNMLVERINPTLDADTSEILAATVDLREVIIVSTAATTQSPGGPAQQGATAKPAVKSAAPVASKATTPATANYTQSSVNIGQSPTTPASPATNQSILSKVF